MKPARLSTPRLLLRAPEPSDRDAYVEFLLQNDAHLALWSPLPATGQSPADRFRQQLERSDKAWADGSEYRFLAFADGGSRLAGYVNLNNVVRGVFQNAYAGWAIGLDLTGRGLATEAVRALLDFAFSPGGAALHRVQANVIPANAASIRVADKAGFRLEGLAPRYLNIAGQWQDHNLYAKTAEEHIPLPA